MILVLRILLILFIILPLDNSLVVSILDFKDIKYVIVLNQGALFFTIFCVYLFYNSLNFSDGLNGISLTVCLYFVIVIILTQNELNVFHYSNQNHLNTNGSVVITIDEGKVGNDYINSYTNIHCNYIPSDDNYLYFNVINMIQFYKHI